MDALSQLFHFFFVVLGLTEDALRFLLLGTRSSTAVKAENLFLRKQLALFVERKAKPQRANDATRLTLVLLSRVVRLARRFGQRQARNPPPLASEGFSAPWRWKSRPRGRPRLSC